MINELICNLFLISRYNELLLIKDTGLYVQENKVSLSDFSHRDGDIAVFTDPGYAWEAVFRQLVRRHRRRTRHLLRRPESAPVLAGQQQHERMEVRGNFHADTPAQPRVLHPRAIPLQ